MTVSQNFDELLPRKSFGSAKQFCATCKMSASILVLGLGSAVLALAISFLVWVATLDWTHGWFLRIIGLVLSTTVLGVVGIIISNFRATRLTENLQKRLAWAGMTAIGFGALELALALASWGLFVIVSGAYV
jgi:hypothetical protein